MEKLTSKLIKYIALVLGNIFMICISHNHISPNMVLWFTGAITGIICVELESKNTYIKNYKEDYNNDKQKLN